MLKRLLNIGGWLLLTGMLSLSFFTSCSDDFDSFSSSPDKLLTFSADSVRLDTVFSNVPSAMRSFWVYNHSGDGLRCSNIRLEHGNQSGFRVNVDGIYLGSSAGYQTSDVEIRKGDSIRVFVELTSAYNHGDSPSYLEDNLVFRLESGVEQKVNLNAYSWDATLLRDVHITTDTLIASSKPIVIYGGIKVDSLVTLTIGAGTTLYFHNDAGIDVYGRLFCQGTATDNVVLRGDRIDRMFDYLPYDNVSGQWQGIHLHESSYGNQLLYTDLHSAFDGIVADSADIEKLKLELLSSTIHNCQGGGLLAQHCQMRVINSQITNTEYFCAEFEGGIVDINSCTIAQFYPLGGSAVALSCTDERFPMERFTCTNTLITGYGSDVFLIYADTTSLNSYQFDHCVIRTPRIETADCVHFTHVIYEDPQDTLGLGYNHFAKIDLNNLQYDFRLDSLSVAIGKADPATAFPVDRNGITRKETPDIGAYEYKPQE